MTQGPIGRLAIRHEGDYWNAYYAMPDTMEKAVPLASIRMTIVEEYPARKAEFMDLMRSVVSDLIEKQIGVRPLWKAPIPAPDHEREDQGGHA
jgi:hypothetical protein